MKTLFFLGYIFLLNNFLFSIDIKKNNNLNTTLSNTFYKIAQDFTHYGNYFEAITEYKRILYYKQSTSVSQRASIHLQIGDLYYKSLQFNKAKNHYFSAYNLWNKNKLHKREKHYSQLKILNTFQYTNISILPYIFNILKINVFTSIEKNFIILNTSKYLLNKNKFHSGKMILNSLNKITHRQRKVLNNIQEFMKNYKTKYSKYNLFYSIFPGGFFFRYQKWKRGFLSFISISSLATGGIYSFKKGYSLTGFILSFFSFKFYLDSIWSSMQELNQMNQIYLEQEKFKLLSSTNGKINLTEGIKISIPF